MILWRYLNVRLFKKKTVLLFLLSMMSTFIIEEGAAPANQTEKISVRKTPAVNLNFYVWMRLQIKTQTLSVHPYACSKIVLIFTVTAHCALLAYKRLDSHHIYLKKFTIRDILRGKLLLFYEKVTLKTDPWPDFFQLFQAVQWFVKISCVKCKHHAINKWTR